MTLTAHFTPTPGTPTRELSFLVEHLSRWLSALGARERTPAWLGVIEGAPGAGQREILAGLRGVCRELGLEVIGVRAARESSSPLQLATDLAAALLETASRPPARGSASASAHLARLFSGLPPAAPPPPPPSTPERAELLRLARRMSYDSLPARPTSLQPDLDRSRLVDALARSLVAKAGVRPLIVIAENIDRAGTVARDLLRHLGRLIACRRAAGRRAPLFVIATVEDTSEITELFGREEGPEAPVIPPSEFVLRLRGATREDLRLAVRHFLGVELPPPQRERLLRLTRGNVRHISWCLRALAESAPADPETGGPDLAILGPDFSSTVKQRLAALPPAERAVVQVLAAARRPLAAGLLEAVLATPAAAAPPGEARLVEGDHQAPETIVRPPPLDAVLGRLAAGDWTISGVEVEGLGGNAFSIADDDVAEAVLGAMAAGERRDLVLRCARALVQPGVGRSDFGEQAFRLFLNVGAGGGAAEAALAATARLREIGAAAEALEMVEEATDGSVVLDHDAARRLHDLRFLLLEESGNYLEALAAEEESASRPGSVEEEVRCRRRRGDLHGKAGERKSQLREYLAAVALAGEKVSNTEDMKLFAALGRLQLEHNDIEGSIHSLRRCDEWLSREPSPPGEAPEVARLALDIALRRGDHERAFVLAQGVLEASRARTDVLTSVRALQCLASLRLRRGQAREAQTVLAEALALAQASGSRWLKAEVLAAQARCWESLRNVASALECSERARRIWAELGREEAAERLRPHVLGLELELGHLGRAGRSAVLLVRALVSSEPGEGDRYELDLAAAARKKRRKGLARLEKARRTRGVRRMRPGEVILLGELLEESGRLSDAFRTYQEGVELVEAAGEADGRLVLLVGMARLAALTGDTDGGLRFLERALGQGVAAAGSKALAATALEASRMLLQGGEVGRSFDALLRGVRLALEDGGKESIAGALVRVADFCVEAGAFGAARDAAVSAARLAEDAGLARLELAGRLRSGRLALERREVARAGRELARAGVLAAALDLPLETGRLKLELAWERRAAGDFEAALRLGREGIEIARGLGLETLLAQFLLVLGAAESAPANARKNFLRALSLYEQALALAKARGLPRLEWEVLEATALLHRERQHEALAREYRERALEIERRVLGTLPRGWRSFGWRARTAAASRPHRTPAPAGEKRG